MENSGQERDISNIFGTVPPVSGQLAPPPPPAFPALSMVPGMHDGYARWPNPTLLENFYTIFNKRRVPIQESGNR